MKIALPEALTPPVRNFLLGAIGVCAALAIILSYGVDPQSQIGSIAYVIGIGLVVAIAASVIEDVRIMAVLRWFLTAVFMIWVILFLLSKVYPNSVPINCAARLWQSCLDIADQTAARQNQSPPVVPENLPPPAADIQPESFRVFFQFAGTLRRDDVKAVMRELANAGWNMQGVEGGGERTTAAAGFAEVRYGADGDAAAAAALAKAVEASKLIPKPISAKQVRNVTAGTLEVFVSN
jgi:hypothetical protein